MIFCSAHIFTHANATPMSCNTNEVYLRVYKCVFVYKIKQLMPFYFTPVVARVDSTDVAKFREWTGR